jgi:poly(hydroxyalkanoate) granule-associated protein
MPNRTSSKKSSRQPVQQRPIDVMRDQAKEAWMTGLDLVAKVQDDGTRVVEKLIAESQSLQAHSRDVVESIKLKLADLRVTKTTESLADRMTQIAQLLELSAAGALSRAGVATKKDVESLSRRVSKLGAEVERLTKKPALARKLAVKAPIKSSVRATKAKFVEVSPT